MANLSFSGQLLSVREGVNSPEWGGNPYTVMEFSPVDGETFQLRADGHLAGDLSQHLRKDLPWSLQVAPRMSNGKFNMKVSAVKVGAVAKVKE